MNDFYALLKHVGALREDLNATIPLPFFGEFQCSFLQASDDDRAALSLAVPTAACRLSTAHSPSPWHAGESEGGVPLQQTLSFLGKPTRPPMQDS